MAQKEKLEQVLELLLSENQEKAAELAHEIIVETARNIYESMMEAEEIADETEDFTSEIESDESEIASDEENDGELDDEEDADGGDESEDDEEEQDVEDRVEDLEAQLAELRAEFDALMDEELEEPNHADLQATIGDDDSDDASDDASDDSDISEFGSDELDNDEEDMRDPAEMFERRMTKQLQVAPQTKKGKKETRVAEETQFLNKVADTGQRGTAKLAGTGNKSSLGAENTKSPYTNPPSKKDYGGKPVKFGSGTGGEYGKYNGETAEDGTITDNLGVKPKRVSDKADATPKYTGGKAAGDGGNKSPVRKQD